MHVLKRRQRHSFNEWLREMYSPHELDTDHHLIKSFTRLFGKPIDLWMFDGGKWIHVLDPFQHDLPSRILEVAAILPDSLPADLGASVEPTFDEISINIFRIGTPLYLSSNSSSIKGPQVYVIGTVYSTAQSLLKSLVKLNVESIELKEKVDEHQIGLMPHLEQISHNFEELTWLKRLSEQVNFNDVCDPLADIAHGMLPDLALLINAKAIVLLGVDGDRAVSLNNREEQASLRVGKPLYWAGERLLDTEACTSLAEQLRAISAKSQPVVINSPNSNVGMTLPQGIDSCVQVAVTNRGVCFGWLIALNRVCGSEAHNFQQNLIGYDQFGTNEASLLNSAAATLATHARSAELFRDREAMLIGVIRSLICAIDAKDVYTCGHSDRVAMTSRRIAEQMGMPTVESERVYMAGLLHDIGKIGVPDHVLLKPTKLTPEEQQLVKQHPMIGYSILKHVPQLRHVLPGVLHHHELVNGEGYPDGLKGDAIPLFGRIVAVADAFDAMTSDRPYRQGMSFGKAVAILKGGAGEQWDATIVEAFIEVMPAVVKESEMSSGRIRQMLRRMNDSGVNLGVGNTDIISRSVALSYN